MLGRHYLLLGVLLMGSTVTFAAWAFGPHSSEINQREQQKALEEKLTPQAPDVRLTPPPGPRGKLVFPVESSCLPLHQVVLDNSEQLPAWLQLRDITAQVKGQCLGVQGINLLMGALQNRMTDHGWITTRVLAPQQDLRQGTLRLLILAGRVDHVRFTEDSARYATLFNTMPAHSGNLLDLRDIEQGLENLQRPPSVRARMEIVPGQRPGASDIVIHREQARFLRLGSWLNDGGTQSTGRYRGGVMLALDNPLSLSDLFYLTLERDLGFTGKKHIKTYSGHYSVPFGYWLFSINGGHYDYAQLTGDPATHMMQRQFYQGASDNLSVQAKRIIHRSASHKTALSYDVMARTSDNCVNNTVMETQKRRTSAWRLGLNHRHYLGAATLDADLSYQQGTRWFGAQPAKEESNNNGTALAKITQWSTRITLPFSLAGERFRYQGFYRHQLSHTYLTPPDQFAIGNRWSVRGFDGERPLYADSGWFLRNDIGWRTPLPNQEWYVAIDYGEINGMRSDKEPGRRLAGAVTGLRGALAGTGFSYELFTGVPLSKPDGLATDAVTLGFNLNWQQ
jgi:hemolysin activation/secretion protein